MKYATRISLFVLSIIGMLLSVSACSTRKNTAASRNYQAFITRYNIYYNGHEHFTTTLKKMEDEYEDEYSRRLYMHPAEAYADPKAPKPSGSFDRSIEKAQKAIQIRSIKKRPAKKSGRSNDPEYKAWMKREEYNPFLHNAWMMMAESQYYKGDFAGAASTFMYITKHFSWLPEVTTEAKLWEACSYCALDWLFEAETILKRIKPETELTNKTLKGLYYFTYADYYIRSNDYAKAAPMLKEAIPYAKGQQKIRLTFLLGQLYTSLGMKKEAYKAFKDAGGASGASYRTQFNARIKQTEVFDGADIEPEIKALKRMASRDRNKEYLDQIYYAIGNLYLSRRDTTQAIDNYRLAVEKSTRSGLDKALVQITLGQLYFDRHDYDLAQPCYSEAVPALPDNFPDIALLKRRSDVLDELAVYSQNVTLQDSLLRLAAMTPEEQLAVVTRIIDELKKKEKEEEEAARREEYLAQQGAQGTPGSSANAPTTFTMNTDNSWYFYNTSTRNAGKTEFQRRWGSRKLEDDWRRRNKASFNTDDFATTDDSDSDDIDGDPSEATDSVNASPNANDPHFPEFYLRQIPKTDAEIATSNDIIQEGLFNMGLILKDKLEDYPSATGEWNRLLARYPDNIYRLDVYYNMYLMNMREHNLAEAEKYRQLILSDFAESKEGLALRDPNFIDNLKQMDAAQEALYETTLDDYLNNRNAAVHEAYQYMQDTYPMSKIMPKFMFLHALAYVTEKKPDEFNATLKTLLERYPETDITPLASAYLKGMAQGRQLHAGTSNMRGMIWDIRLTNDSTATGADGAETPLQLELNPNAPQLLVLLYPTDSVSTNSLLYDIARHNFSTFVVRDFDLELMNFGKLGLLIIKGFANRDEVNHYLTLLNGNASVELPPAVRPVVIGDADFKTLLSRGASFEEYFRLTGQEADRRTHEETLPPDEYPSADEMYPTDEEQIPAKEVTEPAPKTETETEPAPEPQPTPAPKPTPEPTPAPQPQPEPQPTPAPLPEYPSGSEDDPLLE